MDLDDVAGDAYARALELGIPALARALPDAAAGSLATVPQVGEPTYAAKLSPADRLLHVERPAREVHDHVRALSPHIGARLALDGELFVVWRTRLLGDAPPAPPGSLREDAGRLLLACGAGAVEIVELQPPGRRRLDAASWLRGHRGPLPTVTLA
jgi:methionyl-tRNA formyltransferase